MPVCFQKEDRKNVEKVIVVTKHVSFLNEYKKIMARQESKGKNSTASQRTSFFSVLQDDFVVEHKRREILAPYDRFFKKFEHSKALDAALNVRFSPIWCRHLLDFSELLSTTTVLFFLQLKVRSKTPEVTVSVFQELIRRSAIRPALAARNEDSVISIIKFIQR